MATRRNRSIWLMTVVQLTHRKAGANDHIFLAMLGNVRSFDNIISGVVFLFQKSKNNIHRRQSGEQVYKFTLINIMRHAGWLF